MVDESSEFSPKKDKIPVSEVIEKALDLHDDAEKSWHEKGHEYSYHNAEHIEAVWEATEKYLDAMMLDEEDKEGLDPLRLREGLKAFNERNPKNQISEKDLREVMKLAVFGHDLGNIMKDINVEGGEITTTPHDKVFVAKGAEKRSVAITSKLIDASDLDESKKEAYKLFVDHAIMGTVYSPEPDEDPIENFMEIMDQLGNDMFNDQPHKEEGLMEEFYQDNPNMERDEYSMFNFFKGRFEVLVPDRAVRLTLLKIWGKSPPAERVYSDNPHQKKKIGVLLEEATTRREIAEGIREEDRKYFKGESKDGRVRRKLKLAVAALFFAVFK